MIIILSAQNETVQSLVDFRFGRSSFLMKVDTETNTFEAFPNPGVGRSGGAGVAAAQFVIDQKVDAVLSGDFGPNAARAFQLAQIPMYLYSDDIQTVTQAVEEFRQGKLTQFE